MAYYTDVENVSSFKIGQHVHFRATLHEPRWGWRDAQPDSRGIITGVHGNGEVRVSFFGVSGLWKGDPADLEEEEDIFEVGEWFGLGGTADPWKSLKPGNIGVVYGLGYNEGDVWDGTIHVSFCGEQDRWAGQRVRIKQSVKQPRFGWSGYTHGSIGTISSIDADDKLRIYTSAGSKAWRIDPAEVDRVEVEEDVLIGDWVRIRASVATPTYQWCDANPSSIGVVHRKEDGERWVAFCFLEKLWVCKDWVVEMVRPFRVGDKVRIRPDLVMPRWGWGMETCSSRGEVMGVDANGKLRISFKWRYGRLWTGDPADILDDFSHDTRTSDDCCSL